MRPQPSPKQRKYGLPAHPRKKKPSIYMIALKEEKAKLRAQQKVKNSPEGWFTSLRTHIGKAIDNTPILEAAAVCTGTIIVKKVIDSGFLQQLANGWASGIEGWLLVFPYQTARGYLGSMGVTLPSWEQMQQQAKTETKTFEMPEWFVWICSFFVAYLLVRHGGQIAIAVGEGFSGIATLCKMFLPLGA